MRIASCLPPFALLGALATCGRGLPIASEPVPSEGVTLQKPPALPATAIITGFDSGVAPTPEARALPDVAIDTAASARPLLEHPETLAAFFEALRSLERGTRTEDVRVLQFGDSHTAADYETGPLRRALQKRFGDGGRGYVSLGRPWKFYVQEGVTNNGMSGWTAERGHFPKGNFVGDGRYGLVGVSIATSKPGAYAYTDLSVDSSRIELDYLACPEGGSFDVQVDGVPTKRVHTHDAETRAFYSELDVAEGPHRVELIASGDGPVRVFGAAFDSAKVGVTFDALGVNGARARDLLRLEQGHFMSELQHRDPALVILAYGTNESGDDIPLPQYEAELAAVVGRVTRALPNASCLLLGPPDRATRRRVTSDAGALPGSGKTSTVWATLPRILDVIELERHVATAAGCAYSSQLDAMGGPGSMADWAEQTPPKALRDRTHLTRVGYAELGSAIATALIGGYDAYREARGVSPKATAADR